MEWCLTCHLPTPSLCYSDQVPALIMHNFFISYISLQLFDIFPYIYGEVTSVFSEFTVDVLFHFPGTVVTMCHYVFRWNLFSIFRMSL